MNYYIEPHGGPGEPLGLGNCFHQKDPKESSDQLTEVRKRVSDSRGSRLLTSRTTAEGNCSDASGDPMGRGS